MIYLQTVVSEFSARFVQTERANIVQLVSLVSYIAALLMAIRLVRMLQRSDPHFTPHLWRWLTGIMFTVLFPNFLSQVLLRKPVTEVVLQAPVEADQGEDSGVVADSRMQDLRNQAEAEKRGLPATDLYKPNYGENELGGTINNPQANPADFGEDLLDE